jgi:hypothetical protein
VRGFGRMLQRSLPSCLQSDAVHAAQPCTCVPPHCGGIPRDSVERIISRTGRTADVAEYARSDGVKHRIEESYVSAEIGIDHGDESGIQGRHRAGAADRFRLPGKRTGYQSKFVKFLMILCTPEATPRNSDSERQNVLRKRRTTDFIQSEESLICGTVLNRPLFSVACPSPLGTDNFAASHRRTTAAYAGWLGWRVTRVRHPEDRRQKAIVLPGVP